MSIIKKKNPITGEWEVFSATTALEIPILDLKGNFTDRTVEGALRELADKNNEMNSKVNAQSTAISEHSSTLRTHSEDIEWLKVNGGGGGGGGTAAPTITSKFEDGTIVQKDEDVKIPIFFSSPNQGTGTAYIVIDGIEVDSVSGIKQGNNIINIGKLTNLRTSVAIYVKDRANMLSNQLEWTVICGGIDLEVNFDDKADYGVTDQILMQFTVQSASSEPIIMHMTIDYDTYEVECTQGVNEYMFVGLGVGVHKVSFYITSGEYKTNTIVYNIVVVSSNSLFVSSSFEEGQFTYGAPVPVQYRVSKASDEYFEVKLYLDEVLQKTLSVQAGTYYWTINDIEIGSHDIRIEVRSAYDEEFIINKTFEVVAGNYTPLKITEAGLIYRLNAKGRTNQDSDRAEPRDNSGNGVSTRLYNFNWYTNGWIDDELVCDSNAYVEIDCYPWSENAIYGSTIEVQYTGLDIGFNEARIFDYTDVETPYKGAYIDLEESTMKSLANTGKIYVDKDVETTITFVIDRKNKFGKIYIDGICSRAFSLSDTGSGTSAVREDFTHNQKIYLNSRKGQDKFGACKIKDIRIYSRVLSDDEIVQNNIAQITDLDLQEKVYNLNYNNTTLPTIKMYGDTTNMTLETPVTMRVKYTSPNEDKYGQSFDLPYCQVNWQGTSSLQYVLKNFTIRLKDENMADYYYTPYPNGVLENVYCCKADYMESTHARNVGLAKFVNDCLYDTKNPAQQKDDKIRNSINGFPILLYINDELQGVYNFNLDRYSTRPFGYTDPEKVLVYEVSANSDTTAGAFYAWTEASGKSKLDYYKSDFECVYPPTRASGNDDMSELIRLIEWVDNSSDEDFKDNIGRYFNLEYLLRYYLFVLIFGAVDSLGKNMKVTSFDGGNTWFLQVYDADTTIGLNNTGFLSFDMDIEMGDENVFNTTGSKLWQKVLLLFDAELKQQYSLMRQDRFTVDNIMKYLYGEQISQIPATFYNKDMQTKYLNFGSSYLYALHGSGEQHIRKWIRERIMYCDTLLGYNVSSSDYITLRSSKLGEVYLDIETYIPMYLSVKWRDEANNTGLQTKRVGRGEKVRFTYNMPTSTDQEIIIYAGHYLKSLGDVSNLECTAMTIAPADRLTEITCHSPNLIYTDLSECTKLQRIDLSDCPALGTGIGAQPILNIQNCKYLRYCNCMNTQLTAIYTMQQGGNLEEIYYPESTQEVQLTNQTYLHTVGLPSTNPCKNLATVQIYNCNAIKSLSSESVELDFNVFKYVQNLSITNSLSGLKSMQFNGFDKLKNVTLSSLRELEAIGFEDMMPVTTTSTLKNITISDCPLITSLSFNVSSDDYKVAFASNGKLDLGGLQSLKSIECNTSVKGLNTLIVPTSLKELKFYPEFGDGLNEIKNIWSASAVHNDDGFEGIDFQDMTIEFIDMLGLNGISNAINFHIAPKTQNPNLNTARDGSASKPWFHPIGSIDLSNYTGSMIRLLRGVDLNKLDVVISTDRDQVDLTSLFECALFPEAQNIVAKTNNILNKFPNSLIWNYMFKDCDLAFSPNDITIPNRGLSLKGMYKDSNVTEDVNLPSALMTVEEMFMNCTGITSYNDNWLKTYSTLSYTVPTSNGTGGYWTDTGEYIDSTSYNKYLYTPTTGEKAFKIMTTGIGEVRINYFNSNAFLSRMVYTPEYENYPYVVLIPDDCNKIIFSCDKTISFASTGSISTTNCYANTGGDLDEIPTAWGGHGFDKSVTSIYVIDTTLLSNTMTFNLVDADSQVGITNWGDGTVSTEKSHTYREHGIYTIKTKSCPNGVAPHDDVKNALIEVKQIKLIGHNGNTQSYSYLFDGCKNLRKVTAYNLAPSNCSRMFTSCTSLTDLVGFDTWDMSKCTTVEYMFYGSGVSDCEPIYDLMSTYGGTAIISFLVNSNITSIEMGRFPSTVTDYYMVASGCTNLQTIDFTGVSHNVWRWQQAFQGCTSLTSIIGLESLNGNDGVRLFKMFFGSLGNIQVLDYSGFNCKVSSLPSWGNSGLTTVKLGFDWSNISTLENYTWFNMPNITNFEFGRNIKADIHSASSLKTCTKLTVDSLLSLINALYDFSEEGGYHYVDLGSTLATKLTHQQILPAMLKKWDIVGATIRGVFADTDISTLTTDETVTAVVIELTADNYLTRIDEVLGVYTNAVDVYFFEDGSVINLNNMCYENNTSTKDRIQNVTFIDGYFENCTEFRSVFREVKGLLTVTGIPNNVTVMNYAFFNVPTLVSVSKIPSKCTNFNVAFRGCSKLTSVPTDGWTGNLYMTFTDCSSLNQQINVVNPIDLSYTFGGCRSLTVSPTFTGTYTGSINYLFSGCRALTNIVLPTTWRPSSTQNTFYGCTQLVTIENLDALDMSNCSSTNNMFNNCISLADLSPVFEWNMSNCTAYDGMFSGVLLSLDLNWTMPQKNYNLTGLLRGFAGRTANLGSICTSYCKSLSHLAHTSKVEEIYCSGFDTSNVTSVIHMFYNASNIKIFDMSNWNLSSVSTTSQHLFYGCNEKDFTIIANNILGEPSVIRYFLMGSDPTSGGASQKFSRIIMDEIHPNMRDFSGIFEGHSRLKNDIVFPSNATNVSNCFKNCTGITHIHSNWKTEYDDIVAEDGTVSKIVTTDCYAGCTGITHCDGVACEGLDEVPVAWGGFGFSKATTSILELVIPEDNYTLTLNPDMILATIDNGEHSGYDIYNRINWGDGTITEGEYSHTYTTAGTYTFKGHYYMGAYEPTATLKVCLSKIHQIPRYYKAVFYNHRYLAKDCKNLTEVTINNFVTTPNNNGLLQAFNGCTNLQKVTITADMPLYNIREIFRNCTSLVEINGMETWDTSTTNDMYGAFYNCSQLPYSVLLQLSNTLNFDSCTNVSEMFYNDTFDNAIPLQQLKVSNMTRFDGLLSGVKVKGDLDLSMWNVHPTNLTSFLNNAIINGSVNLSDWDVSSCTSFRRMLHWSNTPSVNLSGWDFSGCTDMDYYTFIGCSASDWNFTGASGIKFNIVMNNPQNHSVDSLVGLFNALYDFASNGDTGTHTIEIGSKNLAKLTDEQIAIATNKGWTLS